jgi:hypothetical protein
MKNILLPGLISAFYGSLPRLKSSFLVIALCFFTQHPLAQAEDLSEEPDWKVSVPFSTLEFSAWPEDRAKLAEHTWTQDKTSKQGTLTLPALGNWQGYWAITSMIPVQTGDTIQVDYELTGVVSKLQFAIQLYESDKLILVEVERTKPGVARLIIDEKYAYARICAIWLEAISLESTGITLRLNSLKATQNPSSNKSLSE